MSGKNQKRGKYNERMPQRTVSNLSSLEKMDLVMLGKRVQNIRKSLGMGQRELLTQLFERDVNAGRASDLENGNMLLDSVLLKRLCVILNVSPSYLMGLSDDPDFHNRHAFISEFYHNVSHHVSQQIADFTQKITSHAVKFVEENSNLSDVSCVLDVVKQCIDMAEQQGVYDERTMLLKNAVRQYEVIQARKTMDAFKYLDDVIEESDGKIEAMQDLHIYDRTNIKPKGFDERQLALGLE